MSLLTPEQYLMGRITEDKLSEEGSYNIKILIPKINTLLNEYNGPWSITSGYRTLKDQMRINPKALKSKHLICAAVDLGDKDHKLRRWIISNLEVLHKLDLYMEHPDSTPTWVHLQCIAPGSKSRIFIP